ncbi:MAG TPA: hydrolase [Clostridiales bacterium]|nr:hydrolase [Clostridiales bacterium]
MRRQLKARAVPLLIVLTILAGIGAGCAPPADAELAVHFLDVGQGDAILIRLPGGHHLLIDTGPDPERILGHLRRHGVRALEAMVLTHPHHDHIAGAEAVLAEFPVAVVYDSGRPHTTRTYERLLEALRRPVEEGRTRFILARAGMDLPLPPPLPPSPPVHLHVLHPTDRVEELSINDASIVLRLAHGEVSFLFTGDIEREAEERLVREAEVLSADLLKVAHHGSRTSTTARFLDRVGPLVAVISSGPNPYGHPHREVLERLAAAGVEVYDTRERGTVTVFSDGARYRIRSER